MWFNTIFLDTLYGFSPKIPESLFSTVCQTKLVKNLSMEAIQITHFVTFYVFFSFFKISLLCGTCADKNSSLMLLTFFNQFFPRIYSFDIKKAITVRQGLFGA